jgi:hypothetical protein
MAGGQQVSGPSQAPQQSMGQQFGGMNPVAGGFGMNRFVGNMNPYIPPTYTPHMYQPRMTLGGGFGQGQSSGGGLFGGGMSGGDNGGAGYSGQMGEARSSTDMGLVNAIGNLGMSPGMSAARGYLGGGPLGAALGGLLGWGSSAARDNPGYGFANYDPQGYGMNADAQGYSAARGYEGSGSGYGGEGIGGGGGYGDGAAGPGGNGSAGSDASGGADGPGGTSGGADSGDGSDSDSGDGWYRGGLVTKDRLKGPNPKGPDEGYGALQSGEYVVPRHIVQQVQGSK